MTSARIHFYYKNVTAEVIGTEHGLTAKQFQELAQKTTPVIEQLNQQRKAGKVRYRDLPYNEQYPKQVREIASEVVNECENFVVLGIGGSALGNIALQTALNPYLYNLDAAQRKGPRLFVFDNVDPMQLASFLDWIGDKLDKTIFNVISKSGRTAETAAQFLIIREMLLKKLGPAGYKKQIIATTDPKEGTLRKNHRFHERHDNPCSGHRPYRVFPEWLLLRQAGRLGVVLLRLRGDHLRTQARRIQGRPRPQGHHAAGLLRPQRRLVHVLRGLRPGSLT